MNLEGRFKPFIESLEKGIEDENWISSLMCACTLPDICISLEGKKGKKYYMKWLDKYMKGFEIELIRRKDYPINTLEDWENKPRIRPEDYEAIYEYEKYKVTLFSSVNAYALRCTILHSGNGDVASQEVQIKNEDKTLGIEKVVFRKTIKSDKIIPVLKREGPTIYLDAKTYCEYILFAVMKWIEEIKTMDKSLGKYSTIQNNLNKILVIE